MSQLEVEWLVEIEGAEGGESRARLERERCMRQERRLAHVGLLYGQSRDELRGGRQGLRVVGKRMVRAVADKRREVGVLIEKLVRHVVDFNATLALQDCKCNNLYPYIEYVILLHIYCIHYIHNTVCTLCTRTRTYSTYLHTRS